jgi:hypothetical protein
MQGGQSCCCFYQVATALPFSCNSVWLAPPPARWGHSFVILPSVPWDQLRDSPLAPLWEVGLLPHPHSQPLCLSWPLLSASGSLGGWLITPTTTLSLCCFTHVHSLRFQHWEFGSLPHSHTPGQVQCSNLTSAVSVRLQFTVYAFQFCFRGVQSAQGLHWIMF